MATDFARSLRNAGLRVTKPRLSVYEELRTHPHSSADDVKKGVAERLGKVSTQAVYDVLHTLTEKGIVRRIEPMGSVALYELANHDNHHHLVCRNCGTLVNIDCVVGEAPCLTPSANHGYMIDEAEVYFWGLCPDCQ